MRETAAARSLRNALQYVRKPQNMRPIRRRRATGAALFVASPIVSGGMPDAKNEQAAWVRRVLGVSVRGAGGVINAGMADRAHAWRAARAAWDRGKRHRG